jgi:predicted HTH domain antitoxin
MSMLKVPEDVLRQIGATDREVLIEIACRLYETQTLPFDRAARFAGTDLNVFADACAARKIPVYWYTAEHLRSDLETLDRMGV